MLAEEIVYTVLLIGFKKRKKEKEKAGGSGFLKESLRQERNKEDGWGDRGKIVLLRKLEKLWIWGIIN